jgi:hypothetical protein
VGKPEGEEEMSGVKANFDFRPYHKCFPLLWDERNL